jgi:signal transduction histidine kinase
VTDGVFDSSPEDNRLVESCVRTLRDVDVDARILLERLGTALDVSAVVMARPKRRGMIGEYWQAGAKTKRVMVREPALESVTPAEASAIMAAAAGAPEQACWDAGQATGTAFVLGFAVDAPRYSAMALTYVASCVEISIARELASLTARTKARRSDRALIASSIHQGASQDVGTILVQLEVLDQLLDSNPERARELIADLKSSTRNAQDSLRMAIFDLTPAVPDLSHIVGGGPEGLEPVVKRISEEFSLQVSFVGSGKKVVLDQETLSLLFAFAQEGLTNVRKHSTSRRGCVGICVARGVLRLTVYDEGYLNEDLETTAVEAHGHGLNLMRARAHLLGGDVWLEQLRGGGTALTLEVPV